MVITEILYFNQEDSEAEVSISDGEYTVNCYIYPTDTISVNQVVNAICGFGCANILRSYEERCTIKKMSQHFAYLLTAQVVDSKNSIVRIGALLLNLDVQIPKDIVAGEYIVFSVKRLDCIC